MDEQHTYARFDKQIFMQQMMRERMRRLWEERMRMNVNPYSPSPHRFSPYPVKPLPMFLKPPERAQ